MCLAGFGVPQIGESVGPRPSPLSSIHKYRRPLAPRPASLHIPSSAAQLARTSIYTLTHLQLRLPSCDNRVQLQHRRPRSTGFSPRSRSFVVLASPSSPAHSTLDYCILLGQASSHTLLRPPSPHPFLPRRPYVPPLRFSWRSGRLELCRPPAAT